MFGLSALAMVPTNSRGVLFVLEKSPCSYTLTVDSYVLVTRALQGILMYHTHDSSTALGVMAWCSGAMNHDKLLIERCLGERVTGLPLKTGTQIAAAPRTRRLSFLVV